MRRCNAQFRRDQFRRVQGSRRGITWIELLIAISAVGLLTSLCWPLILSVRETARQNTCRQHLRTLGAALHAYHDTHAVLPPAAIWSTAKMNSLALHRSRRFDLFTHANWMLMLLPFSPEEQLAERFSAERPISHDEHARARRHTPSLMSCPSDEFNRDDNPFVSEPTDRISLEFGRGNYALNAGSNCFDDGPGSTAFLTGDSANLVMNLDPREFRWWGNGIGGFNVSFSFDDFTNGASTLVALDELRAGIHPLDPRGVWSLGQVGGSITWAHGVNSDAYGPNNQEARADDILNCGLLHEVLGSQYLQKTRMPCVHYVDLNFQATARSSHPGGVNVLLLDGSARFISDAIDPALWHVMHSRETPQNILENGLDDAIAKTEPANRQPAEKYAPTSAQTELSPVENSLGMQFAPIPAGEFIMGLADSGNDHDLPEEAPAHTVRITRPFLMARHEVTRAQFEQVMQYCPDPHPSPDQSNPFNENFPVTQVTWDEAAEFCRRLSALAAEQSAGRRYRLPTEAQWEYACRGGSDKPYAWSQSRRPNDTSGDAAGILPPLPLGEVGTYPPNAFGLYDMRGNAWEWCADWFARDYYSRSPRDDPRGPSRGYIKVVRGSDWTFVGEGCKISYPMMPPWKSNVFLGFRVVCEVDSSRPATSTAQRGDGKHGDE